MTRTPRPDTDEGFLARWSRRKRGDPEPPAETAPAPPPPAAEEATEPHAEMPVAPKTDADMPPVESIGEATDMRDFFSPEVSEGLRRVALRKLFHLPKFNVVDGLDDYDDDFRDFAALGDIVTADMRHQMERAKEEAEAAWRDAPDDQAAESAARSESDPEDGEALDEAEASGAEDRDPPADGEAARADDPVTGGDA